jgi:hypothetical protein
MHLLWMAVKLYKMICSQVLFNISVFEEPTPKILLNIKGDHQPLINFSVFQQIIAVRL